jgi:hypothetical protein
MCYDLFIKYKGAGEMKPPLRQNVEVTDLLQNLSNSYGDREGREAFWEHNDEYINGVKKALPQIEKALQDLKVYLEKTK